MIFLAGIKVLNQAEWRAPLIPELGRQRWAVLSELKASLGYTVRPYQKKERGRLGVKNLIENPTTTKTQTLSSALPYRNRMSGSGELRRLLVPSQKHDLRCERGGTHQHRQKHPRLHLNTYVLHPNAIFNTLITAKGSSKETQSLRVTRQPVSNPY